MQLKASTSVVKYNRGYLGVWPCTRAICGPGPGDLGASRIRRRSSSTINRQDDTTANQERGLRVHANDASRNDLVSAQASKKPQNAIDLYNHGLGLLLQFIAIIYGRTGQFIVSVCRLMLALFGTNAAASETIRQRRGRTPLVQPKCQPRPIESARQPLKIRARGGDFSSSYPRAHSEIGWNDEHSVISGYAGGSTVNAVSYTHYPEGIESPVLSSQSDGFSGLGHIATHSGDVYTRHERWSNDYNFQSRLHYGSNQQYSSQASIVSHASQGQCYTSQGSSPDSSSQWTQEMWTSNGYSYGQGYDTSAPCYTPCPEERPSIGVMGSLHGASRVEGNLQPRQSMQHSDPYGTRSIVPSQPYNQPDRVPDIFPESEHESRPLRGRRCDICGQDLRRPGLLDDHLNTHTGLRRK
ncbi:hypothetical protein RhiJN_06640 [Ceratobasidium sp. AG-Ba]|nr:hypothetical protein RhiJN_06640 [Ceratobasidium sp. AG-Ba]